MARPGRSGFRVDAHLAAVVVVTLGLLTWVGSAGARISFGPLAFAIALATVDASVAFRRSLHADARLESAISEWRGGTLHLGHLPVGVSSVRALTANGETRTFAVAPGDDGSASAEPPEISDRPVKDVALEVDVTARVLGLVVMHRRRVFSCVCGGAASQPPMPVRLDPGTTDALRPYVAGDARNRVDWKSTARTNILHVRSTQVSDPDDLVVVAELLPDVGKERHASAIGAALDVLSEAFRQRRPVRLVTCTASNQAIQRTVESEVRRARSLDDIARAVARIVPSVVDDPVSDVDQAVERLARCRVGVVPPVDPSEVRCS